jgi:hypothetical protein
MFLFTLLPFFWAGWLSSIHFVRYKRDSSARFLGLGFFHHTVPLGPTGHEEKRVAEISIFTEIFVFKGCLALSASLPLSKFYAICVIVKKSYQ